MYFFLGNEDNEKNFRCLHRMPEDYLDCFMDILSVVITPNRKNCSYLVGVHKKNNFYKNHPMYWVPAMCGRFSLAITPEMLQARFGDKISIDEPPTPNFNVAPTQNVPVLLNEAPNSFQYLSWGLVPFWSKDGKRSGRMINARSETVAEKPSFRSAFRKRRCLVPADSFYEWKRRAGEKIPFRIQSSDGQLLVMAGIWEQWGKADETDVLRTFSILTTSPNKEMQHIHDRMPVLLTTPEDWQYWINSNDEEELKQLLKPAPDDYLRMYEVSTQVNNVRNNGPSLHDAVGQ